MAVDIKAFLDYPREVVRVGALHALPNVREKGGVEHQSAQYPVRLGIQHARLDLPMDGLEDADGAGEMQHDAGLFVRRQVRQPRAPPKMPTRAACRKPSSLAHSVNMPEAFRLIAR